MVTVEKKVRQSGGNLLGSKHQGHNVSGGWLLLSTFFFPFPTSTLPVRSEYRGQSQCRRHQGPRAEEVLLGFQAQGDITWPHPSSYVTIAPDPCHCSWTLFIASSPFSFGPLSLLSVFCHRSQSVVIALGPLSSLPVLCHIFWSVVIAPGTLSLLPVSCHHCLVDL